MMNVRKTCFLLAHFQLHANLIVVFNSMSLSSSLSVPPQTLDWDWSLESTNTLRGLNTEPLFTPDSPKQ